MTKHKTLGEMLLSGDFAKPVEKKTDDQDWQRILDEAGYGLPDNNKPKQPQQQAQVTVGLLGHISGHNQEPKQPSDTIFDALRSMTDKK